MGALATEACTGSFRLGHLSLLAPPQLALKPTVRLTLLHNFSIVLVLK